MNCLDRFIAAFLVGAFGVYVALLAMIAIAVDA